MGDYGRAMAFGIHVDPSAADLVEAHEVARRADAADLDLIGMQDHPYQRRFLETWLLMATLVGDTERIHVFPNVANLLLRGAAMIAKQAASLDVLSGGRFELALGAGSSGRRVAPGAARYAVPVRPSRPSKRRSGSSGSSGAMSARSASTGASMRCTTCIPAFRQFVRSGSGSVLLKPRMRRLTGRLADGWSISPPSAPPEQLPAMQRLIDEGAAAAGRQPNLPRSLDHLRRDAASSQPEGDRQSPGAGLLPPRRSRAGHHGPSRKGIGRPRPRSVPSVPRDTAFA